MLPRTHRFLIHHAVRALDDPRLIAHEPDLAQGSDDEDTYALPLVGRVQALGFTHTFKPGAARGELGAPSAKAQALAFVARAAREKRHPKKLWWLGRASHLVGDAAVPARTRGVWHLLGDPFEAWVDENLAAFEERARNAKPANASSCEAAIEALARTACEFPADTTRMPIAWFLRQMVKRGVVVTTEEARVQADVLVPLAVAHLAAFLRAATDECW